MPYRDDQFNIFNIKAEPRNHEVNVVNQGSSKCDKKSEKEECKINLKPCFTNHDHESKVKNNTTKNKRDPKIITAIFNAYVLTYILTYIKW